MGLNDHRARAIRQATFGRENREPIAKSCEVVANNREKRVDKIEDLHNERVNLASTQAITGTDNYYTLILTRANGE